MIWSRDILFTNLTLYNSSFWTFNLYDCKNKTIMNVTIKAPIFKSLNTDGIDPDLCENIVIEDRYISVGDDAIAIKSK